MRVASFFATFIVVSRDIPVLARSDWPNYHQVALRTPEYGAPTKFNSRSRCRLVLRSRILTRDLVGEVLNDKVLYRALLWYAWLGC